VSADVSEEHVAPIFRVEKISSARNKHESRWKILHLGIEFIWNLCWTKWRWDRFLPSASVSLANSHSMLFIIIIIIYHPGLV
jgi:hypothetical protein